MEETRGIPTSSPEAALLDGPLANTHLFAAADTSTSSGAKDGSSGAAPHTTDPKVHTCDPDDPDCGGGSGTDECHGPPGTHKAQ